MATPLRPASVPFTRIKAQVPVIISHEKINLQDSEQSQEHQLGEERVGGFSDTISAARPRQSGMSGREIPLIPGSMTCVSHHLVSPPVQGRAIASDTYQSGVYPQRTTAFALCKQHPIAYPIAYGRRL